MRKSPRGGSSRRSIARVDPAARRCVDANDAARPEVRIQLPLIDRRRPVAVVARRVGVGAEVHRRVQRRQGQVVAAGDVEQHLAGRRRILGPDPEALVDERRDVPDPLARTVHQKRWRIAHRSGNSGLNNDFFRNSTPRLPPVPRLLPIVRSTVFTWW